MDGPLPPSPGQAQGLEVFGMPAFHPAVSNTLPLAGDGCLHMEHQCFRGPTSLKHTNLDMLIVQKEIIKPVGNTVSFVLLLEL